MPVKGYTGVTVFELDIFSGRIFEECSKEPGVADGWGF
jgi:hypothetical protein